MSEFTAQFPLTPFDLANIAKFNLDLNDPRDQETILTLRKLQPVGNDSNKPEGPIAKAIAKARGGRNSFPTNQYPMKDLTRNN